VTAGFLLEISGQRLSYGNIQALAALACGVDPGCELFTTEDTDHTKRKFSDFVCFVFFVVTIRD